MASMIRVLSATPAESPFQALVIGLDSSKEAFSIVSLPPSPPVVSTPSQSQYAPTSATSPVRKAAWSSDGSTLVTASDDKVIRQYSVIGNEGGGGGATITPVGSVTLPKKPSALTFAPGSSSAIVVGDRFGQIWSFSLPLSETGTGGAKSEDGGDEDEVAATVEEGGGKLLAGALSSVMALDFTSDSGFLLVADSDEHLRICHWPNSYNISAFALGNRSYVSSVVSLPSTPNDPPGGFFISGSGDGTLRAWSSSDGVQRAAMAPLAENPNADYWNSGVPLIPEGLPSIAGIVISPDGSTLAVIPLRLDSSSALRLISVIRDPATGAPSFAPGQVLNLPGQAIDAEFSADGTLWVSLASGPSRLTAFQCQSGAWIPASANAAAAVVEIVNGAGAPHVAGGTRAFEETDTLIGWHVTRDIYRPNFMTFPPSAEELAGCRGDMAIATMSNDYIEPKPDDLLGPRTTNRPRPKG